MAKQHEQYRVYRTLLHLYPKAHRQSYGQQMVQTLDDMLAERQSRSERFTVWVRVFCELPINIIEENIQSVGDISVNKLTKITSKQYLYIILAVLVIGSYLLLGLIWRHQRNEVTSLNNQLSTVTKNQFAMSGGSYYDATIAPSEGKVYFPLAKLKLTDTTLNEGLVYTYVGDHTIPGNKKIFSAELSISTHDLAINNYSTTSQFDCTQVAYADFVTPSHPVNPHYKSDGKTTLADGRTMNIYYAPSIPGCDAAWHMNNIDSKAIADSLKQAASY